MTTFVHKGGGVKIPWNSVHVVCTWPHSGPEISDTICTGNVLFQKYRKIWSYIQFSKKYTIPFQNFTELFSEWCEWREPVRERSIDVEKRLMFRRSLARYVYAGLDWIVMATGVSFHCQNEGRPTKQEFTCRFSYLSSISSMLCYGCR